MICLNDIFQKIVSTLATQYLSSIYLEISKEKNLKDSDTDLSDPLVVSTHGGPIYEISYEPNTAPQGTPNDCRISTRAPKDGQKVLYTYTKTTVT